MPEPVPPDWLEKLLTLATGTGAGAILAKLVDWWQARREARLKSDTALNTAIDARIRMILEDDEKTIARLTTEVDKQSTKIEALTRKTELLGNYITALIAALKHASLPVPERPKDLNEDL